MLRPEEAQRPFTVTELANEIRRELRPLTAMLVKGEVSGMKRGTKGHYSFAIKDGQSLINGFLYADDARLLASARCPFCLTRWRCSPPRPGRSFTTFKRRSGSDTRTWAWSSIRCR